MTTDTNERQFGVLREFLERHDADPATWEALDGLHGRWLLGKEMGEARQESHRRLEAELKALR
jgi:hypothetical protein